jgi:hypothetical protein
VHPLRDADGANPLAGLPASEPVGQGGATTATAAVAIPVGPGGAGATVSVASTASFEMPGRLHAGGTALFCSDNGGTAPTFTGCVTTGSAPLQVQPGEAVTADAIVPAGAVRDHRPGRPRRHRGHAAALPQRAE